MMHLCWATLLLCLSAHADDETFWRESGGTVTLKCSYEGCPGSRDVYHGMYLYQYQWERREVIYYHTYPGTDDKITTWSGFTGRIQMIGPLKNHNITISNLTAEDSGFYSCVYLKAGNDEKLRCEDYRVFVRGVTSFASPVEMPREKSLSLVLIVAVACTIIALVTTIFMLLIVPRVRRWTRSRRATNAPQVSNDYVYEVMTKNGFRPAPQHSVPSLYDCA